MAPLKGFFNTIRSYTLSVVVVPEFRCLFSYYDVAKLKKPFIIFRRERSTLLRLTSSSLDLRNTTQSKRITTGIYYYVTSDCCSFCRRIPSWCDRILWRVEVISGPLKSRAVGLLGCRLLNYRSSNEFTCSDHKPVIAQFCINVNCNSFFGERVNSYLFSSRCRRN